MDEMESLSHAKGECKYHVVCIPKHRRRTLYGELWRHLGEVFRKQAEQKESWIEEGHLMPDPVHMMIAIPPKYGVSQVIGFIKGKSGFASSPKTAKDDNFKQFRSDSKATSSANTTLLPQQLRVPGLTRDRIGYLTIAHEFSDSAPLFGLTKTSTPSVLTQR